VIFLGVIWLLAGLFMLLVIVVVIIMNPLAGILAAAFCVGVWKLADLGGKPTHFFPKGLRGPTKKESTTDEPPAGRGRAPDGTGAETDRFDR